MHKMPGPKVRVVANKAVAIRVLVVIIVMVMGRPVVRPTPWIPMSSRSIQIVSLKGINQSHLVILSNGLVRFSQKTEFGNCSF